MSEANEVGRPAEAEPTILTTKSGSELRRTVREEHLHLPRKLLERSVWRSHPLPSPVKDFLLAPGQGDRVCSLQPWAGRVVAPLLPSRVPLITAYRVPRVGPLLAPERTVSPGGPEDS